VGEALFCEERNNDKEICFFLKNTTLSVNTSTDRGDARFFHWPAAQGLVQSLMRSDPFGQHSTFIWFTNFTALFTDPLYLKSIGITLFSVCLSRQYTISTGLFVATMANRALKAKAVVRTLLIWPYAVAPAISGILWLFLLHPSYGVIALAIKRWFGVDWNPVLRGSDAMFMIIMASAWKQISYNFVFFIAGLQAIPKSLIEAAAIDGASPFRRFWTITVPLLFADAVFRYGHEHHLFIFRDLRCCSYDVRRVDPEELRIYWCTRSIRTGS